jgi:23S rRNA (uracil1939-C5)-methyltransferase
MSNAASPGSPGPRTSKPSDIQASCPHRPPCPGCPRFGEIGISPAARTALRELAQAHGIADVAEISGERSGFRLRARLAIRGRVGSPKVGLFELGSHRVVHIPHCYVQHPLINHVAAVVRRALVDARVTSYSDKAHLGVARYLQVVVERSSRTAQVVMVANTTKAAPLAECFELIRERLGVELHSLWLNFQVQRSNAILGPDFHRWCGSAAVVERFGGAAVHYPPGAFGQNNLDIAQNIVEHVRAQIPDGASVTEFYAGVGAIGLSIVDKVDKLTMNEVGPQSLLGLELGIARLDPSDAAKITVLPGPAGGFCSAASGSQVVIADPPRKGLDAELTEFLRAYPPERFLYVSCGLNSFLNDTARLTAGGRLKLVALTAFNLMPFTEHVETLASFERTP